ncbi:hypothetical protein SOV_47920 [Sporomusa ovata DSM 2662]|nr:DUF1850 domain-containing protein [Sporomusa ovata]EQB27169.1 hypothetical protein SOV_2c00610 [Sporomusa ovata DSM 2662]
MVKKVSKQKKMLVTGFCLLIGIVIYWWFLPLRIVIETESGIALSLPTYPEDTFSIRFTHSVHKTPVWENFVVRGVDELTLTSTEYRSYGVGMPSLPSEGVFTQLGDRFILTNLNRSFRQIPVRVGPEAKLSFIHQEQEYPLYQWFDAGTLVTVRINYDYWWFVSGMFNQN